MIRPAAVAGSFYPADPQELVNQIDSFLTWAEDDPAVKAVIVPHAGLVYSGAVAGEVFSSAAVPPCVLMLGPNHHGGGPAIAVSKAAAWATPLGAVPVASELRTALLKQIPQAEADDQAHQYEHSLEIMLPFLLRKQPELQILPIALGQLSFAECQALGAELATLLKDWQQPVLLLASSDMNHFFPAAENKKLDNMAISAMTDFDPQRLYQVVKEHRISMCGVLPTVVVMHAALQLGAEECRLVRYSHSGEVSGDNSRVVGYAGLAIR